MSEILKQAKEHYDEVAAEYVRANYYATHPLNEFWGSVNLRTMRDIISNARSTRDVIHGAQKTYMFSVNEANEPIARRAVQWLLNERTRRMNGNFDHLEESELSYEPNNVILNGRRYTPDFLRCVNIAARIVNVFHQDRLDIVELGGGLGHLARVLKLAAVSRSHVIIDIPETLVFSYCFLRESFPAAKFVWVRPNEELPADYDFAFVPAMLCNAVTWRPFDLFLNTASMGEMRNEVIRKWMKFIQGKLNVKMLFTLNRFLNTITEQLQWRLEENECQQHFDRNWDIVNWDLEPSYTRCPYIDTRVSRYVEIAARRTLRFPDWTAAHEIDRRRWIVDTIEELRTQDWARLWNEGHVMGMRDGPICVEGDMNSTIFKLWELSRLAPSAELYDLMLKYLSKITPATPGVPVVFEEVPYYLDQLHRYQTIERVLA